MTPRRLIEPARLAGAALLHTQSDERLVDLTRAGNGRAFEAIVTRYRKPLLRHCAVRQLLNRARNTLRGAATAITPQQLLVRLAERASTDAPTLGRIAEICTGAGGAATLAKVATAVLVTGAVAGGVAVAPLHKPRKGRSLGEAAQAAELAVTGGQGAGAGSAAGGSVVAGGSLSGRGGGSSDSG